TTSGTTTDNALSINFTGFTGTFNHAAATTVNIGGSSTGDYTVDSGMTYTVGSQTTSKLTFVSTVTTNNITTADKTMPAMTFNGAKGGWQLQDNLTMGASSSITLTAGALDTNDK